MYPSVRHIEENGVQCIIGRSFLQWSELVDYLVVVIGKSALPKVDRRTAKWGYGDKEISGTLRVSDIRFSNVWLAHIEADVSFQMSTLRFTTCFGLLFRNGANVVAHPVVFFGIAESACSEIIIVSSDGCFLLRC